MPLGTPVYPTTLDTAATVGPTSGIVAGTTPLNAVGTNQGDQIGITNNIITVELALEAAVGVTNSTVTTSHEYRIRRRPWKQWVAGLEGNPPATLYATFGTVNAIPFLAFNDAATWTSTFIGMVPWGEVFASGIIVRLKWASATAITNAVKWGVAYERLGVLTVASDHFGTQVTGTTTVGGTVELFSETAITIPYANMVSSVAGDPFRLQVQRLGADAADTMVGDAQLFTVSVENAA